MIASNVALTTFTLRPSTAATALTMSGSMPITVCPSGAMNSSGAYSASLATISVPLDLIFAGTCAAIAAFSLAALVVAAVEELFLLLPQPAIAAIASSATPTRKGLLIETSCGGVEVRPALGG